MSRSACEIVKNAAVLVFGPSMMLMWPFSFYYNEMKAVVFFFLHTDDG